MLERVSLFAIMGSTHGKAPTGIAPLAIGLCLTGASHTEARLPRFVS